MDDLKDILLENEEVLWSGKPDWASEKIWKPPLAKFFSFSLFQQPRSAYRFRDVLYAVTNQRLLVLRDKREFVSADWSKLQAYDVRRAGKAWDVTLSFERAIPDFLMITLYALPSLEGLERIIFETHPNGV